jgi:uncharacterized protein (DUF2461 family)
MMLNAKIGAAVDLQKEFQQIIDKNPDCFNTAMYSDMKRCLHKAQKDHGVNMIKEK